MACEKSTDQRGSTEIVSFYRRVVATARTRIWAIGMTNKHFVEQHLDTVLEVVESRSVDFVLAFWDPESLVTMSNGGRPWSIVELQSCIEGAADGSEQWARVVKDREVRVVERVEQLSRLRGTVRILRVTLPTSISCLVVDDSVFFFPFLARADSTNDPAIYRSAEGTVGSALVEHFEGVFEDKRVTKQVFPDGESEHANRPDGSKQHREDSRFW